MSIPRCNRTPISIMAVSQPSGSVCHLPQPAPCPRRSKGNGGRALGTAPIQALHRSAGRAGTLHTRCDLEPGRCAIIRLCYGPSPQSRLRGDRYGALSRRLQETHWSGSEAGLTRGEEMAVESRPAGCRKGVCRDDGVTWARRNSPSRVPRGLIGPRLA
ncbi:hypothetical protein BU16DRAFT_533545 [Lophium mytilinum]|uniref:Uncharacterized protein n=1 Tax=Lophium mytilinum TaxID=390894 RepID=A0A6A6RF08_9PEZI|nr:hypothetical protein BU16DRAFT_533545 [Lophium mytilinum]